MTRVYDFDIALSFAGDHRAYVVAVADGLRTRGFRVFYDQYAREELLGQELIEFLQDVYSRRSATVAAFISEQWVVRPWPAHERQTVLARALLNSRGEETPFLFPFRFDDTPVPGLQPSVAYEDLRILQPGERHWKDDPRYKHPKYVVSLLTRVLVNRRLGPPDLDLQAVDTEQVILVHFVWIHEGVAHHATGPIPLEDFETGELTLRSDEVEPHGPAAGRYVRVRDDLAFAIDPHEPLPVFLIDTHEAKEKSWTAPFGDSTEEVNVVDHVRRQVQQAVEIEIADGAVPLGPTFTSSHHTPYGPAVFGICVVARIGS